MKLWLACYSNALKEASLKGPHTRIQTFLQHLDKGKLIPWVVKIPVLIDSFYFCILFIIHYYTLCKSACMQVLLYCYWYIDCMINVKWSKTVNLDFSTLFFQIWKKYEMMLLGTIQTLHIYSRSSTCAYFWWNSIKY